MKLNYKTLFPFAVAALLGLSSYGCWCLSKQVGCLERNLAVYEQAISKLPKIKAEYERLSSILAGFSYNASLSKKDAYELMLRLRDFIKQQKYVSRVSVSPPLVYPGIVPSYSVNVELSKPSWSSIADILNYALSFSTNVIPSLKGLTVSSDRAVLAFSTELEVSK